MISSASNKQIKQVIQLGQKAKLRHELKQFIVEGIKMYNEIPEDKIITTFIKESYYNENKDNFIGKKLHNFEIVSDKIFDGMSQTKTPQGILAIVKQPEYDFEEIISRESSKLLFLEDVRDPGNIGTMIRTAEGAGFDGIVLSKESVDMFNPKVVRSTMGAIYRVPFIYEETLTEIIHQIQQKGFPVYATAMKGSEVYDKVDYTGGAAMVIGNEANGVSEEVLSAATGNIRIPMAGELESLNAAVSAAIVMYETARQRR